MSTDRVWPTVGQKLVHKNPRTDEEVTAEVIAVDPENHVVRVRIGAKEYSSLSTAAKAVRGGSSVNGWVFWGLKRK